MSIQKQNTNIFRCEDAQFKEKRERFQGYLPWHHNQVCSWSALLRHLCSSWTRQFPETGHPHPKTRRSSPFSGSPTPSWTSWRPRRSKEPCLNTSRSPRWSPRSVRGCRWCGAVSPRKPTQSPSSSKAEGDRARSGERSGTSGRSSCRCA